MEQARSPGSVAAIFRRIEGLHNEIRRHQRSPRIFKRGTLRATFLLAVMAAIGVKNMNVADL
jgi:hypothetical protein